MAKDSIMTSMALCVRAVVEMPVRQVVEGAQAAAQPGHAYPVMARNGHVRIAGRAARVRPSL